VSPAPVEPIPPPATDAPAHVAPEPAPPAPAAHTPLGGPPVAVENWPVEADRQPYARVYRGFSVRLSAQLGLASATRDLDGGRTRISGLNGGVMLDVGATAADNFILYGRVGGFALNHASSSDSPNAGSAYFGLLGAGARLHFMPFDWYASGTLSLALATTTNDLGVVENAEPGVGMQLETGKNWGTGSDAEWATVGAGLRFSYVRCGSVGGIDEPWIGMALSLVFSIAYN
jgi:hypothetical protein